MNKILICNRSRRVWRTLLHTCLLAGLCSGMLGCATGGNPAQPQTVAAIASTGNTYVVRRAAARTASTVRMQSPSAVQRPAVGNSAQLHRFPGQLTRAQYHARYQARKAAEALARIERKKAEEAAIRSRYIARWEKKQQQQRAEQKRRALAQQKAQVAAARKQAAARQQHAARQPVKPTAVQTNQQAAKPVAAQRPDPRAKYLARWKQLQAEKRQEALRAEQRVERVIHSAKRQIGRKYVWGGASPKRGFDCSGLVQHSINKGANVSVPRTALEQYQAAVKVPVTQAERGDLVFFITRGKRVSHVGIYLGDNKFVHAPRTGRRVSTDQIKGYWKQRLVGFGRIPGACRIPLPRA